MNERLVLIFLIVGIISGGLLGVFVVSELEYAVADPVTIWMRIYMYITINLVAFYTIAIGFLWYCEKKITTPVETITRIARGLINKGNDKLDCTEIAEECEKLVGNHSEAGVLAEAFKSMVLNLDTYIHDLTLATAENERITTELSVARGMQLGMLPSGFPEFSKRHDFEIYATIHPAEEIGGDFYDFFLIDNDHLGVVIADVSGKGIPAALFMVISRTLINNSARSGKEPKDVFTTVNTLLCEGNENSMFVTAWIGVLEISTGVMVCVNAGHDPPIVLKQDGSLEFLLAGKNIMLAGMGGTEYTQSKFTLSKGDVLYLYTDGVTDASNRDGIQYGKERLCSILNEISSNNLLDILSEIKSDVDEFADGEPQFDDITMLLLKVN